MCFKAVEFLTKVKSIDLMIPTPPPRSYQVVLLNQNKQDKSDDCCCYTVFYLQIKRFMRKEGPGMAATNP